MLLLDELSATCLRHVAYAIVKAPRGRSKLGLNSLDFAAPRSELGSDANIDTRRRSTCANQSDPEEPR